MRIKVLYDNFLLRRNSTPTSSWYLCGHIVNVSIPGKIIINVNAQKHCVSGKRNYIAINYYIFFINVSTFLFSVE